jgi:transcription initiation factor TFIIIB Brf1 subunit/transcription initiation factor TFIIB
MLESVARKTSHAGQTTVTITSSHAKATVVQAAMRELTAFFKELARTAEQLGIPDRVALIAKRAYRKMLPALRTNDGLKLLPTMG